MGVDLDEKIINQIEYYFGDINLPRDKFLQEKIKEDDGWVPLEVLLTFKRLADLSKDPVVIAEALGKSENNIVELNEEKSKVRRNPERPPPEFNDERKKQLSERTAYAKGFPLDEVLDNIKVFMEPHGPIESVQMRTYKDNATKQNKFKGSCFVIFKDVETCKKFVEAESIKYKEVELTRKMQPDYFEEKRKEIADRKAAKEKKKEVQKETEKKFTIPKGVLIHFKGIKQGESLTREQIKEKLIEAAQMDPAFLDFNKGDTEGYIRMRAENDGIELNKKLDGTLTVNEIELELRVLEGEEEDEYLKKAETAAMDSRRKFKGKKRKGNFQNDGFKNKRR